MRTVNAVDAAVRQPSATRVLVKSHMMAVVVMLLLLLLLMAARRAVRRVLQHVEFSAKHRKSAIFAFRSILHCLPVAVATASSCGSSAAVRTDSDTVDAAGGSWQRAPLLLVALLQEC